jgi:type I restriction enzyme, R subunit
VSPHKYTEDALIEQPTIELFRSLKWDAANCFHEFEQAGGSPLGRETPAEVVLVSRLRPALEKLNPDLPAEAITKAIEELTRDRSVMTATNANRDVYRLIKDGVRVDLTGTKRSGEILRQAQDDSAGKDDSRGRRGDAQNDNVAKVKVIDWENPKNNDFFLASQFWVSGEMYKRRADLVGFVNGLPLVFVELKASHKRLEDAYNQNLRDYKDTIPQLFWFNAFIILSNGSKSCIGSLTATFEHFAEWKKINDEGEHGVVSLETMIRGTCEPSRLLDVVENFILFSESKGGLVKMVAKNHQYLGVNRSIAALQEIKKNKGRLGVFWHTQGSGKSYSMVFFAQKAMRKLPGNYTFVVVTDRQELDEQIYKNFAYCGVVTEVQAQATSGEHLKQLLKEDHRYVFTLIQKFHTEKGQQYPKLSDRSDIIVMTDEAHRSQYDIMAMNMRNALPNAAFIGFTGTPLMAGEEKTREVFGDYVSIYNFKQSVDDGATVPLYYENRIPELQLTNADFKEDMEELLESAELDAEQEKKLEREFAREYHLITRDDRLEKIAEDIVSHFMGRGHLGKAMVVCIDKATAVRMYDKVRKHWKEHLDSLKREIKEVDAEHVNSILDKISFMEKTDMAVVVSQSQNEVDDFRKKGLDIATHRKRMNDEDMDEKFKDPKDPFRIVFVCAMWMTGFDVPSCSTIYVDKPMRNHTLMQTIARANRVFPQKINGLIVDYVGIFRDLRKALAIYGSGSGGGIKEGDTPVIPKAELIKHLKEAAAEAIGFCADHGIDLAVIPGAKDFAKVKAIDDAVEAIIVNDATKLEFLALAYRVNQLFKAALPDRAANDFYQTRTLLLVIAEKIKTLTPAADISKVMEKVERLLDESVATEGYVIPETNKPVDLTQVDFDALKRQFEKGRKRMEAERLRRLLEGKVAIMIRLNKSRMDYLAKLQEMIDEYNAGSINVETFFSRLVEFSRSLQEEDQRHIKENLSEEELAIFDLLTKHNMQLTKKQEQEVKKVAEELLETLKREKLVLDWRKRQQSRAAVEVCIKDFLDRLPPIYTPELYRQKCGTVYQHVYDSYYGQDQSLYSPAT